LKLQSKSNVLARPAQGAPVDYHGKQVKLLAKKLESGLPLGAVKRKTTSFTKGTTHDPWAEPERAMLLFIWQVFDLCD
jgi:hypothetical protein